MTSFQHDSRLDHHPHAHRPHHPHDHDHPHVHDQRPGVYLSRRHFLAVSAGALAGVLLLKVTQVTGKPIGATPAATKRIYLAPDDHTDYMWTADKATYQAAFLEMLDTMIRFLRKENRENDSFQSADKSISILDYATRISSCDRDRRVPRRSQQRCCCIQPPG